MVHNNYNVNLTQFAIYYVPQFLPPTKEEVHVFARVCLSVCLSVC